MTTKHSVTIEWKDSAHSVLIAGDFSNWQGIGTKRSDKGFSLELNLPEGTYQYKYVVDGTWKYRSDQMTFVDPQSGNINNVIKVGDVLSQKPDQPKKQQKVTGYEAEAGEDGFDYDKLINEFGTTRIDDALIQI